MKTRTATRPVPTSSVALYYQGRPNVAFLDRYGTIAARQRRFAK